MPSVVFVIVDTIGEHRQTCACLPRLFALCLAAMTGDSSQYAFTLLSGGGPIVIMVELRFRCALQSLMDVNGCNMPDVVMEEDEITVVTLTSYRPYLPLVAL